MTQKLSLNNAGSAARSDFLAALYPNVPTKHWLELRCIHPSTGEVRSFWAQPDNAKQRGAVLKQADKLNAEGYGLYFAPCLRKEKKGSAAAAALLPALCRGSRRRSEPRFARSAPHRGGSAGGCWAAATCPGDRVRSRSSATISMPTGRQPSSRCAPTWPMRPRRRAAWSRRNEPDIWKLAPGEGFEPPTKRLTAARSTTELPGTSEAASIAPPEAVAQPRMSSSGHARFFRCRLRHRKARWRPRPESNRCTRICSPLHNHSATGPLPSEPTS